MFVLAAFRKFGGAPGPLVGLFTGDEEIGSPEGRPVIEAEGATPASSATASGPRHRQCRQGAQGRRVQRRGHRGQGGAFGRHFEAGISAIGEAAHKIVAIHALTDLKRGITLNVGLIRAGSR